MRELEGQNPSLNLAFDAWASEAQLRGDDTLANILRALQNVYVDARPAVLAIARDGRWTPQGMFEQVTALAQKTKATLAQREAPVLQAEAEVARIRAQALAAPASNGVESALRDMEIRQTLRSLGPLKANAEFLAACADDNGDEVVRAVLTAPATLPLVDEGTLANGNELRLNRSTLREALTLAETRAEILRMAFNSVVNELAKVFGVANVQWPAIKV
jgi:limonene-1,2-epoxide hydrolase